MIAPEDVAEFRAVLNCAQDSWYVTPAYQACYDACDARAGAATQVYNDAIDNTNLNFAACATLSLGSCAGYVLCLAGCTASGPASPACVVGCTVTLGAGCAYGPVCADNHNFALRNANRQYQKDLADCRDALNRCKANVDAGGSAGGGGASPPPMHER